MSNKIKWKKNFFLISILSLIFVFLYLSFPTFAVGYYIEYSTDEINWYSVESITDSYFNTSVQYDFCQLPQEGDYFVRVVYIDEYEKKHVLSISEPFGVDSSAPVIEIISPISSQISDYTMFNFSVTDQDEIDTFGFYLDGALNYPTSYFSCGGDNPYCFIMDTNKLSDGSHVMRVFANDSSSNYGDEIFYFTVSNTIEGIRFDEPYYNSTNENMINISIYSTIYAKNFTLEVNEDCGQITQIDSKNWIWNATVCEGNYELIASAIDFDDVIVATESKSLYIDRGAPSFNVVFEEYAKKFLINVTDYSFDSSYFELQYSYDGVNYYNYNIYQIFSQEYDEILIDKTLFNSQNIIFKLILYDVIGNSYEVNSDFFSTTFSKPVINSPLNSVTLDENLALSHTTPNYYNSCFYELYVGSQKNVNSYDCSSDLFNIDVSNFNAGSIIFRLKSCDQYDCSYSDENIYFLSSSNIPFYLMNQNNGSRLYGEEYFKFIVQDEVDYLDLNFHSSCNVPNIILNSSNDFATTIDISDCNENFDLMVTANNELGEHSKETYYFENLDDFEVHFTGFSTNLTGIEEISLSFVDLNISDIKQIYFYVDNILYSTNTNTTTIYLDTNLFSDGTHQFKVIIEDIYSRSEKRTIYRNIKNTESFVVINNPIYNRGYNYGFITDFEVHEVGNNLDSATYRIDDGNSYELNDNQYIPLSSYSPGFHNFNMVFDFGTNEVIENIPFYVSFINQSCYLIRPEEDKFYNHDFSVDFVCPNLEYNDFNVESSCGVYVLSEKFYVNVSNCTNEETNYIQLSVESDEDTFVIQRNFEIDITPTNVNINTRILEDNKIKFDFANLDDAYNAIIYATNNITTKEELYFIFNIFLEDTNSRNTSLLKLPKKEELYFFARVYDDANNLQVIDDIEIIDLDEQIQPYINTLPPEVNVTSPQSAESFEKDQTINIKFNINSDYDLDYSSLFFDGIEFDVTGSTQQNIDLNNYPEGHHLFWVCSKNVLGIESCSNPRSLYSTGTSYSSFVLYKPFNNSVFDGNVEFTAFTTNNQISKVQFYLGETLIDVDDNVSEGGFSIKHDVSNYESGKYLVEVIALDTENNELASDSSYIYVDVDSPQLSLNLPYYISDNYVISPEEGSYSSDIEYVRYSYSSDFTNWYELNTLYDEPYQTIIYKDSMVASTDKFFDIYEPQFLRDNLFGVYTKGNSVEAILNNFSESNFGFDVIAKGPLAGFSNNLLYTNYTSDAIFLASRNKFNIERYPKNYFAIETVIDTSSIEEGRDFETFIGFVRENELDSNEYFKSNLLSHFVLRGNNRYSVSDEYGIFAGINETYTPGNHTFLIEYDAGDIKFHVDGTLKKTLNSRNINRYFVVTPDAATDLLDSRMIRLESIRFLNSSLISRVYDTTQETLEYDFLSFNSTINENSNVRLQLRTSSNYYGLFDKNWKGPDSTSNTYFNPNELHDLSSYGIFNDIRNQRYVQFKVFFEEDGFESSTFENFVLQGNWEKEEDLEYLLKINLEDEVGNSNEYITEAFTIDDSPPIFNLIYPKERTYLSGMINNFDYNIEDLLSGVNESSLQYSFDGSQFKELTSQTQIDTRGYMDGEHIFTVRVKDNANNLFEKDFSLYFSNGGETTYILFPNSGQSIYEPIYVSVFASGTTARIDFYIDSFSNIEYLGNDTLSSDGWKFYFNSSNYPTGYYDILVKAYDSSNNSLGESRVENIFIDNEPPNFDVSQIDNLIKDSIQINVENTSYDVEKVSFEYSIDETNWYSLGEINKFTEEWFDVYDHFDYESDFNNKWELIEGSYNYVNSNLDLSGTIKSKINFSNSSKITLDNFNYFNLILNDGVNELNINTTQNEMLVNYNSNEICSNTYDSISEFVLDLTNDIRFYQDGVLVCQNESIIDNFNIYLKDSLIDNINIFPFYLRYRAQIGVFSGSNQRINESILYSLDLNKILSDMGINDLVNLDSVKVVDSFTQKEVESSYNLKNIFIRDSGFETYNDYFSQWIYYKNNYEYDVSLNSGTNVFKLDDVAEWLVQRVYSNYFNLDDEKTYYLEFYAKSDTSSNLCISFVGRHDETCEIGD